MLKLALVIPRGSFHAKGILFFLVPWIHCIFRRRAEERIWVKAQAKHFP
jgi:hypothetical protein